MKYVRGINKLEELGVTADDIRAAAKRKGCAAKNTKSIVEKNPELIAIGNRIKAEQKAANKKRADVAKETGIPEGNLARYESGGGDIPILYFAKIAKALNVPADYLLGISESKSKNPTIRDISRKYGLGDAALKALNFFAASSESHIPDERIKAINAKKENGEELTGEDYRDVAHYSNAERKKNCLAAINTLLSWRSKRKDFKNAEEILSRLFDFLNKKAGEEVTTFRSETDGKYGTFSDDILLEFSFNILRDRLKELRSALWNGEIYGQKPTESKVLMSVAFDVVPDKTPDESGLYPVGRECVPPTPPLEHAPKEVKTVELKRINRKGA